MADGSLLRRSGGVSRTVLEAGRVDCANGNGSRRQSEPVASMDRAPSARADSARAGSSGPDGNRRCLDRHLRCDSPKPDVCEYRTGVCRPRFCATCVVVTADTSFSNLSITFVLHVRLPNGVEFDLGEANVREQTTIVQNARETGMFQFDEGLKGLCAPRTR